MESPRIRLWLWPGLLAAVLYLCIGALFAALAASATVGSARTLARVLAWVVSVIVLLFHVRHEQSHHNSIVRSALYAASGIAFGAFLLAACVIGRLQAVGAAHALNWLALVVWPVATSVPAFLLALAAAATLNGLTPM